MFMFISFDRAEEIQVKMSESHDCVECKVSLYGHKYILKEENAHCINCFEANYSNNCEMCQLIIGCTSKVLSEVSQTFIKHPVILSNSTFLSLQDLSYKDRHWHSDCFLCIKCSRSLVSRSFATKDDMLMCTDCYCNEYSAKCHSCLKTIMPGE